jgi:hypothetical protein
MSWPWASPEATRRGLADRVKLRHPGPEIQLRLYEVAFRRVLARLEAAKPGRWVLKGGVALLLRLDPNRTSDDIDIAYLDAAGQHGVALAALERALTLDLGDHFSFAVRPGERDQGDAGIDETIPLRVEARIGGRRWVEFGIDLGYTEGGTPTESLLPRENLTGLAEVDAIPAVRSLAIDLQVAQKLCAMFELHGEPPKHSSRARDLVDLAMIATQVPGIDAGNLRRHVESEQARRLAKGSLRAELPRRLELAPVQVDDWRRRWARATRAAPMSLDEAHEIASALLNPILDGTARGEWSPADRAWRG